MPKQSDDKNANVKECIEECIEERVEQGWQVAEKLFGYRPPEGQVNGAASDIVMAQAYAEIWSRPELDLRTRAMITVVALAVQGNDDELRVHLRGLAHQGVTHKEALEIMLHLSIYAGWPVALHSRKIVEEVYTALEDGAGDV